MVLLWIASRGQATKTEDNELKMGGRQRRLEEGYGKERQENCQIECLGTK